MSTENTVSDNPVKVQFPQDSWGFTTGLRKAGLKSAGAVRGNEEKLAIYLKTLATLAQHAQARFAGDKAAALASVERNKTVGVRARGEAVAPLKDRRPEDTPAATE